jgi:nitrogen-specific signal transduction histidine kinase/DNA-binding NarL/FixJ family response regulator
MAGASVLVASADRALVDRLVKVIDTAGLRAEGLGSVADAVARVNDARYRVAVLDADGVSGHIADYLSAVRKRRPDIGLLVIATHPARSTLLHLLHARIDEFLPKPISTTRLHDVVRILDARGHTVETGSAREAPSESRARTEPSATRRAAAGSQALDDMLKRQVSQLTILYQMGRDISENENWSDALDRFLMALVNYIGAEGAALLLFSDDKAKLSVRSNFQVDPLILSQSCQVLVQNWTSNPRGGEIHAIESYRDMVLNSCLDRRKPWRFTVVPLRHRSRSLGFLFADKLYGSGHAFRGDYYFLNALQTILSEEVANATYISDLRQLGRFNQKVLDNIKSGVITTDLAGYVRFHNTQAAAMCPQLAAKIAPHFDRLFESEAFGGEFYEKILRSPKDTHVLSVKCCGRDARFPARVSITKMNDDHLNGTVLVAIFEDLTEQRQLEAEIRRNDRLRVLGQLSAGVAHEIRNPLTGIATSVELLGDKVAGDEDKEKYIRVIMDEINRLNEIIRNLLNFARPAKPQLSTFGLAELSRRVARLLGDEARKKGVELGVEDYLKHENCNADVNQMTQVLLNVVLNSIQACGRGDAVKIVLKNEESADGESQAFARIDVIDSGTGVPPQIRSNLFEPFVTTKSQGTGLGLAISHQIMEEHHGQITCEFLKKGTCFTIRLPIETGAAHVLKHTAT